jgi:cobalamin synthase
MRRNSDFFTSYVILPFMKAWNLFFQVQLPENNLHHQDKNLDETQILCFIPVIGLTIGLITYLFSSLIYFCAGTIVAAILCPFLIVIFIEYLNHSKDSVSLVNLFTSKFVFYQKTPANKHQEQQNTFMFYYIFISIFIIRILCFASLIYFHRFAWLIIMFVLTYAVQGYLATTSKYQFQRNNLLHATSNPGIKIWLITFFLCLLFGGIYLPTMLLAFLITVFIGYKAKIILKRNNALNGINIGMLGKVMEIFLLLLGLLYRLNFS